MTNSPTPTEAELDEGRQRELRRGRDLVASGYKPPVSILKLWANALRR
jgi:hypothetical protein